MSVHMQRAPLHQLRRVHGRLSRPLPELDASYATQSETVRPSERVMMEFSIQTAKCTGCDVCFVECPTEAITNRVQFAGNLRVLLPIHPDMKATLAVEEAP